MAYPYQPQYAPQPQYMYAPQPQQPQVVPAGQLEQLRAAQYAAPQPAQQSGAGIIWVQGEEGAKAYMVAPGASVMLMDSEGSSFYIKSADASGMPMPLRIFDYVERAQSAKQPAQTPVVAESEDMAAIRSELARAHEEIDEIRKQLDSMKQNAGSSRSVAKKKEEDDNGK